MSRSRAADAPHDAPTGPLVVAPSGDGHTLLSVVIPTLDERDAIGPLVRAVSATLDGALEGALAGRHEIVVVDDDSRDRTWEAAFALVAEVPGLRVVRRQGERGLATAVLRGWQIAQGDVLAVLDGDLQHPPEILLDLWRAMERGADLAVASRHVEGGGVSDWSLRRRALSRGAQALGLVALPRIIRRVSDPMSGYFMVRRGALAGRELAPLCYKILVEVLAAGAIEKIDEVPYVFRERSEGGSKVTWRVWLDYVRHIARLRWRGSTPTRKAR